jgi:hypothetical protein
MIGKQTTLDLNGPILSFVQQPVGVSTSDSGSATFVGIATAFFPEQDPPNPATNTGTIEYRWYSGGSALSDGTFQGATITGSGTTTLTITNATSPAANGLKLFVGVDYVPSAYSQPVGSAVTVGTGRSTGNAVNEILNSNTATLTVFPVLTVAQQPTEKSAPQTRTTIFTTLGALTDTSQGSISYRWQIGCVDAVDGTQIYNASCGNIGNTTIDVTNESTGVTTNINLSSLGRYSDFTPGIVYTLVPKGTFTTTLRSVGAKGGNETRSGSTGGFGGLAQGTFTFIENQVYKLMVAGVGVTDGFSLAQQNPAATASGGGSGTTSVSTGGGGQGGGYTGLFRNSILQSNAIIIGGGGGGANRDPGRGSSGGGASGLNNGTNGGPGRSGGSGTNTAGGQGGQGGNSGIALKGGDGVQGLHSSGGGGGYFGGGGGGPAGVGGGGSGFIDSNLITSGSFIIEGQAFPSDFSGGGFGGRTDGRFEIIFGPGSSQITSFENTVVGSGTTTLTISSKTIGTQQVKCVLTHPTAGSIFTNTVNFTVVDARQIITFEQYSGSSASIINVNLFNGEFTLLPANTAVLSGFYAPERDINVEMDIFAAAGRDNGGFRGGEGGFSRVRFTLPQNVEFLIAGFNFGETGYIYRRSSLMLIVGAGGWAGPGGNGGSGGGIGVAGGNGSGRGGGTGAAVVADGTLGQNAFFGSSAASGASPRAAFPGGGRALSCPIGEYWRNQGFSPCQNMGNIQFRLANGTNVSNSAVISRGFKAGRGIRQTAGAGDSGAKGGTGATGGNGGTRGGGGGGGSGYQDGSIQVVQTTLGGNTSTSARIIVRAIL